MRLVGLSLASVLLMAACDTITAPGDGKVLGGSLQAPPQPPPDEMLDLFDRKAHLPGHVVRVASGRNAVVEWRLYAFRQDGRTCVHFASQSAASGGAFVGVASHEPGQLQTNRVGRGSQTLHPYYEGEPIPLPEKNARRVKSGPGSVAEKPSKAARPEAPAVPQLAKRLWPKPHRRAQRRVDRIGNISFAGAVYNVGRSFSGSAVEVFTVEGMVHIALDGDVIKRHDVRHTPEQEEAALRRKRPLAPTAQRAQRTLAAQEVGP